MMACLPYENAQSGTRALAETERILQRFGCQSFGSMQGLRKEDHLTKGP